VDALIRIGLIRARRGDDDAWDYLHEAGSVTGAATYQMVPVRLARAEAYWLCAAYTNAQIAAELGISAKTVGHHVTAVLAKMGVPNRTSAVRQASSGVRSVSRIVEDQEAW
jgi:DNA-binding CsgD family transcriptional regulator